MKRLLLILACVVLSLSANAQLYIYNVNGNASVYRNGVWSDAFATQKLQPSDSLMTGDDSYLVILDRGENRMYSFQSAFPRSLSDMVQMQKPRTKRLLTEVCQGIYNSMFGRDRVATKDMVNGVVYRSDDEDKAIVAALAAGQRSSDKVSFRFVDAHGRTCSRVKVGEIAEVEVTNRSESPLYINIIDIDSHGNVSSVFPMDEAQAQFRLFVPPHAVVRFEGLKVEFYEPLGVDNLILVASMVPFDVVNVLKLWSHIEPCLSNDVLLSRGTITIY